MPKMSYLEAALTVLERAGRPLTTREVTEEALRQDLLASVGKTPKATMSAELYLLLRSDPHGRLVRLAEPGPTRARRGGVRWTLRDSN
jgi:hypothetical protein